MAPKLLSVGEEQFGRTVKHLKNQLQSKKAKCDIDKSRDLRLGMRRNNICPLCAYIYNKRGENPLLKDWLCGYFNEPQVAYTSKNRRSVKLYSDAESTNRQGDSIQTVGYVAHIGRKDIL